MREILFRAKRKNWRELPKKEWWVEGNYHHQTDYYGDPCDKHYIIDGTKADMEGYGEQYEIDPETLCQFTGLKDKNGKRIWENDIVQTPFRRFVVTYSDGVWSDSRGNDMRESVFGEGGVVIGNIFDHPELMKGEAE